MNCINCKGTAIETDNIRGEEVCIDCGYVLVSNLTEETHNQWTETTDEVRQGVAHSHTYSRAPDLGILGSSVIREGGGSITPDINRKLLYSLKRTQRRFQQRQERSLTDGYLECNMVLAPYLPNSDIKQRTHVYYKKLLLNHHFSLGDTMPIRATGLVYFILKEYGITITVDELSKANNVNPHKVSKMSRKIARCLGKPYVLHRNSNSEWVEKIGEKINADREFMMECRDVVEFTSSLMDRHCIHFSKTYLAASMWFTSLMRCKAGNFPEFSQVLLCNTIGCSEVGLRNAMLKMLGILDMDIKQVKMLTVKEFTAGVRYG